MNKQRLMELAGINEASRLGASGDLFVVWTFEDGQLNLIGPFSSEKDAQRYIKWEAEEFDLDDEWSKELLGKVGQIYPPEW